VGVVGGAHDLTADGTIARMNADIETQIRACEARLSAAMLASDVTELDALIADDLLFAGPRGELATKAMDVELHRTGATQFHEVVPKTLDIRVWSEQFVLASAKTFVRGTYLGSAFAGEYRYTRIWRNSDTGWQIAGGSVSAMG
jgi:ketosteroid isomerase-like protein